MQIRYVATAVTASAATALVLAVGSGLSQSGRATRGAAILPKRGAMIDFPTIDVRCQLTTNDTNSGDELSCDRRSMDTKATLGVHRTVVNILDDTVIVVQSHPFRLASLKRDP